MKKLIAMILAAAMVLSLAACGQSAAPAATQAAQEAEAPKKLTIWVEKIFNDRPTEKLIERCRAWGEAKGVEVEISEVGAVDFANKLSAAIEGGGMPDIFTSAYHRILNFYPQMIATDITDLYNELDAELKFRDGCKESTWIDGKAYIIPLYSSATLMYCRADKLKEAGFTEPPKTWDEVFKMAEAVKDPDNDFFGLGIGCGPTNDDDCYDLPLTYIHSNGCGFLDKDGNLTIDNPAFRAWLQMWKDEYAAEVIPTDSLTWDSSGNNNSYLQGRVAFCFNAATLARSLATDESLADMYANTWVSTLPEGSEGFITQGGFHGLAISEASQNKDLAKELLKYVYKLEWLEEYSEYTVPLLSPSVESIAMGETWQSDPVGKYVVESANHGKAWWGYGANSTKGRAIGSKLVYTFKMNDVCNAVASGDMTVDEAVAEYQKAAEEIASQVQ